MTGAGEQFVADFRVLRRLGAGGMGEVFLVQHPRLPRRDALKLLDGSVSRNQEFRSRFQREADVLAPLSHANITTLYDRGEWEGRLWLTMEYVDGQDAADLLKERGPLPVDLAIEIVGGAAAALDYAYADHAITHRDVKPANILVAFAADGSLKTVKLADFGIAKAASEATSLTSTGVAVGTMSYMAPEAIEGRALDNRADIYSLGCTAFQLLTGALPFTGNSIASLMAAHLSHPVPAITAYARYLPDHLDEVFARVLAKDPDDRYQNCGQFVRALRAVVPSPADIGQHAATALAPTQIAAPRAQPAAPTPPPEGNHRAAVLIFVTLGVVGLIIAAVAFQVLGSNTDDHSTAASNTTTRPAASTSPSPAAAATFGVRVYNISAKEGLAKHTADRLRQAGWNIAETGTLNLPDVSVTTVLYDGDQPGERESAQALGGLLHAPVEPRTEIPGITALPPGLIVLVTD